MSARQSVYRLDRSSGQETSTRMVAYALLDVADAIREHTAALPPPPRSVGRCTEVLQTRMFSATTAKLASVAEHQITHCDLDHGHTGAHVNDEHGTTWTDTPKTPAPSEPAADDRTP